MKVKCEVMDVVNHDFFQEKQVQLDFLSCFHKKHSHIEIVDFGCKFL